MAVRLIKPTVSILTLILEVRYTISRAQADARAAFCIPLFEPLRTQCLSVQQQELEGLEALSYAQAHVDAGDEGIDDFASRLSKALLNITKDDRKHTLYLHYFGNKSLSVFLRPKLGAQLSAMKAWVDSLTTSPFPALQTMAAELVELITRADIALAARAEAQARIRKFRNVGARRQLFDTVNVARKKAEGELATLAIETPGLSSDYPDHFFRSAPESPEALDPTIESLTEEIADLELKLVAARTQLTTLQEAAVNAKKEAEERAADEAKLADLNKQGAELEKEKQALRERLEKR
jgi:hypothetical protein